MKQKRSVYIDFENEFHEADHSLLLRKLPNNGVTGKIVKVIELYLDAIFQKVRVRNSFSEKSAAAGGVLQGENLLTMLFNVFVNDLQ